MERAISAVNRPTLEAARLIGALLEALEALLEPEAVTELRVLHAPHQGTISGYFDAEHRPALAEIAARWSGGAVVHVTPNPVNAALLARAENRVKPKATTATGDKDIIRLARLLIDLDPVRPSGISSTDVEHEAALARMNEVAAWLGAHGWPEPLKADSGNGAHLVYAVALDNTQASVNLLKRVLEALAFWFNDEAVVVDTTTYNPARIWKLYGTQAVKGDSTKERPHRLAQMLSVPKPLGVVPLECLGLLAASLPHQPREAPQTRRSGGPIDVEGFLAQHGMEVAKSGPWQDGKRWVLRICPWNPDHQDRSAYVLQFGSGAVAAGCQHNGCSSKTWADLRAMFDALDARQNVQPGRGAYLSGEEVGYERNENNERTLPWPSPPAAAAFDGLAGEVVELVRPYTEADPVAVLVQFLVAVGNAVGRGPHSTVGATIHYLNTNAVIAGETSKARKGDSWNPVRELMYRADAKWAGRIEGGGLGSGEGVIWAVRDPIEKTVANKEKGHPASYETQVVDAGVADKRLLVVETEYTKLLRVMGRQGNTLSPIIRQAWDRGDLSSLTKNTPAKATGAHISIIGHITVEELRRELGEIEAANGFANRNLWIAARRSQEIPEPELFAGPKVEQIARRIGATLEQSRQLGRMERDANAKALWREVYHDLSAPSPGLAGAILARAEAHVLRLSTIYAALAGSPAVQDSHLISALELWAYVERTVKYIWGDVIGDPVADTIRRALHQQGHLTRTEIWALLGRNTSVGRLDKALQTLAVSGKARVVTEQPAGGGRKAEVWLPA